MLPPKDFLALHAPSGEKAMQKRGISTLDDLFAVIHKTMNANQTLPHEEFALAPRHALYKGQLFHFLKVYLPGVGFLLADAIKSHRVFVGGKRKGNREWVSLIPLEKPPLMPAHYTNELVCPITCEPFVDPVVASDGHTYERAAIVMWIEKTIEKALVTSPMTGAPLTSLQVYPNHIIKSMTRTFGTV